MYFIYQGGNTMSRILLGSCVLAAAGLIGTAFAETGQGGGDSRRAGLVVQVLEKWGGYVEAAYDQPAEAWGEAMLPTLMQAPLASLEQAAGARSFDAMNDALLGKGGVGTQALGDAGSDLVFFPLAPCRVLDTRVAGGVIAANTSRNFNIASTSNFTAQGGSAGNCGVGNVTGVRAVAMNVVAVTPSGAGYLTAYAAGAPQPLAATVNYTAGSIVNNLSIVPLDADAAGDDIAIYTFAQTHVVGDVVGYYAAPQATPVDCTQTFVSQVVAANATFDIEIPSCPVGYSLTGAGCRTPGFNQANWAINGLFIASPTTVSTFCSGQNTTASQITVQGGARCCRIPGR